MSTCSNTITYTIDGRLKMNYSSLIIILVSLTWACSDTGESIEKSAIPAPLTIPGNFPEPIYDLSANPLTEEGIALGKMLFYEPALSRNNTISCGFCHQQASAFTHHGHDLSHGIDDKLGRRNFSHSKPDGYKILWMACPNLVWSPKSMSLSVDWIKIQSNVGSCANGRCIKEFTELWLR